MSAKQILNILELAFRTKKKSFKNLSHGYIAEKLGVSSSLISKFFKGERSLPAHLYPPLFKILDLDVESQDLIANLVLKNEGWSQNVINKKLHESDFEVPALMNAMEFTPDVKDYLFEGWEPLTILEASRLIEFQGDLQFFVDRLEVDIEYVKDCWERLQQIGALEEDERGVLRKSSRFFRLDGRSQKALISNYHKLVLKKTIESIQGTSEDHLDQRLVMSATFTCDPKQVAEVKARINAFIQKTVLELESENRPNSKVYQFGVQFLSFEASKSP